MSILIANNRIFKAGNLVFGSKTAFTFQTMGLRFPNKTANGASGVSGFSLTFNDACTVSINFGDGTTIAYPTKPSGGVHLLSLTYKNDSPFTSPLNSTIEYSAYVYSSGNSTTARNISVIIADTDRNKLTGFSFDQFDLTEQSFKLDFLQYPNFETLNFAYINNSLLSIDNSFLTLSNFRFYSVFGAYSSLSANYGVIPVDLLAKSTLTSLRFGDAGFATKTFAQNRMDMIQPSFPNIRDIVLLQIKLTDAMGLPSNFANIPLLQSLSIDNSALTAIPNVIGSFLSLYKLSLSYTGSLTSWGNLTGLGSKLNTLDIYACGNLTATLPAYFSSLNRLRNFFWADCGFGQSGKIDTFITNFYNLIIANAAITGASTLDFRGMRLKIEQGAVPAGTYQQPTGYVTGSNNGTPASSLERIWVLTNQYLHTITYRTV